MKSIQSKQVYPKRRKHSNKYTYKEYHAKCRFKFKVEAYPDYFDLELLESVGWYSKSNNNGISRDHKLSISYGWKHDIDPMIMRHPANCCFMRYEDNKNKASSSSISLNQLLKDIETWDSRAITF